MPHDLTEINGEHAFVYNQARGNPWHKLGMPVQGDMTMEGALRFSRSNDTVELQPVYAYNSDGDEVQVPHVMATVSDIYGPMAVVGENWKPQQRSELVRLAYEIAGIAGEDARIDTMGNLGPQGQRFFTYIRFPEFVLDPHGIADTIERGLFVGTAFDGSMANTIGLTNVRVVCANTFAAAMAGLQRAVKVKHTANADERMTQAAAAIGYAGAAQKQSEKVMQDMLRVEPGKKALSVVLNKLWPLDLDEDNPWLRKREEIHEDIWALFHGETNAELVGDNGWAAYNAVTEWLDHERTVRVKGREAQDRRYKQTLVDPESNVNAMKVRAASLILEAV